MLLTGLNMKSCPSRSNLMSSTISLAALELNFSVPNTQVITQGRERGIEGDSPASVPSLLWPRSQALPTGKYHIHTPLPSQPGMSALPATGHLKSLLCSPDPLSLITHTHTYAHMHKHAHAPRNLPRALQSLQRFSGSGPAPLTTPTPHSHTEVLGSP